jgi:predicted metal-dependent hydrolase
MKIIKSFRKTISLKIDETGELIVKSPLFASKKTIENFIEKNKNWISEKKYETLERIREFTA